jgi:molybdopterin/thiamine biosynthesis adenylyltransferase
LCCGIIGAGAVGSTIAEGLARKGVGELRVVDPDVVEVTNLNRQSLFFEQDIGNLKTTCLVHNLARHCTAPTVLRSYPTDFHTAAVTGALDECTVLVVGVDSHLARLGATTYSHTRRIPCITIAISRLADGGYVFVHEPNDACWACAYPSHEEVEDVPCPGVAAVKDVVTMIAGFALYAVDSLVMPREREWNHRRIYLHGSIPDVAERVKRRADCPLCAVDDYEPRNA